MKRIVVVIPAFNEAKKIFSVVGSVCRFGYDVVVVDDGSSDTTGAEALRAGAYLLNHCVNRGYGAALITGNAWALAEKYDVIVHFDADGQHDSNEITKMIEPLLSGQADVAIGSRFLAGGGSIPLARMLLLKFAVFFTRIVSDIRLTDTHNGFRAFLAKALVKMNCTQDGMSYASEVLDCIAKLNLRFKEVPVTIRYTEYSRAKGGGNFEKINVGVHFLWRKLTQQKSW